MINIMTMPYMAIDSTIPTNMNTFDWSAGFSLMTARPAEPTYAKPMPAPSAAKPKAKPALRNYFPLLIVQYHLFVA